MGIMRGLQMESVRKLFNDFIEDEEGLTLLEYILGAALIVAALLNIGFWSTLATKFTSIASTINNT
jgi:pilus assembly protein Flp/PilA